MKGGGKGGRNGRTSLTVVHLPPIPGSWCYEEAGVKWQQPRNADEREDNGVILLSPVLEEGLRQLMRRDNDVLNLTVLENKLVGRKFYARTFVDPLGRN